MKEKLLEIWRNFNVEKHENEFYSIIGDDIHTAGQDTLYLVGSVYMKGNNDPYIEVSTSVLQELVVPGYLSMNHQRLCQNMTTYRVGVFWLNEKMFLVEGYDTDGRKAYDDMEDYTLLFTAEYNPDTRKWIIPLSELSNAFNYETDLSSGAYRRLSDHIRKLCQIFEW